MQLGKVLFLVAGAVVGGLLGFLMATAVGTDTTEGKSAADEEVAAPADPDELARLQQRLDDALQREKTLSDTVKALREVSRKMNEAKLAGDDDENPSGSTPIDNERRAAVIASVAEADGALRDLILRGDIEGLWLLGADLLALGEEGYEKIIELSNLLEPLIKENPAVMNLWRSEEIFIGSFAQALSDNHEELLRFGLYLQDIDPSAMDGPVEEFQEELLDEMGAVLLGYYRGGDPEILGGYVDAFRTQIPEGQIEGNNRDARRAANALAQIGTEESTDLLIDMLGRSQGRVATDVVGALAWQGNPRALAALRAYRGHVTDDALAAAIDMALRFLER